MSHQQYDNNGRPVPVFKYGTTQKKAYTDTAAAIDAGVGESTRLVLVWTTTDCHIAVGPDPTATTDDKPVTAKVDTPVALNPGDKISAIRQTDNGTLYVTELS